MCIIFDLTFVIVYEHNISLQGDTMQNVASDLEKIFRTGHYNFIIPENMAESGKVELMYRPSAKRTRVLNAEIPSKEKTSGIHEKDESVKVQIWDCEQASTFVTEDTHHRKSKVGEHCSSLPASSSHRSSNQGLPVLHLG